MKYHQEVEQKLNDYLSRSTAFKNHDDRDHWYDFVDAFQRHEGYVIDEAELREIIGSKLKENDEDFSLEEDDIDRDGIITWRGKINEHISDAVVILEFLKRINR